MLISQGEGEGEVDLETNGAMPAGHLRKTIDSEVTVSANIEEDKVFGEIALRIKLRPHKTVTKYVDAIMEGLEAAKS